MPRLAKDISVTLTIKLFLLFCLWVVCFKGHEKPNVEDPLRLMHHDSEQAANAQEMRHIPMNNHRGEL